jgi:hypothetical protein
MILTTLPTLAATALFAILFALALHCVPMQGGRVQGYGVMEYSRGSKYEGEWRMGKKWGQGSMTYPDGARYDGQWQVTPLQ